jgi:hypothetical protein
MNGPSSDLLGEKKDDIVFVDADVNEPPSLQASSNQLPRRSAMKANYNYDNQFQYLEDDQQSDVN